MQKLKTTFLILVALLFATSCENLLTDMSARNQKGKKDVTITSEDEDSDRPDWAGGNTDDNIHSKGNDDSGTTRGGEYGDLYQLLRDANGVPKMTLKVVDGVDHYFVQPIAYIGDQVIELELNDEGEVIDDIPPIEVEFGRLNIVRSPQSVLDQALDEAMKVLGADGAVISLDFCGRLTSTYPDPETSDIIVKTIDSPRESMALYQYIMKHMFENTAENNYNNRLGFLGEPPYNFDPLEVAASCFAAGSDKTGTVDIDEVVYINGFIDCIGLNPIPNDYEYDFNNEKKWYFNFGDCDGLGNGFSYSRDVYKDRDLQFYNFVDGEYVPWKVVSVWDAMELGGLFTYEWGQVDNTLVSGFALAVDDAVQVLDYVHGNSNIEFIMD